MSNGFETYVLYKGKWIREEDWFWKTPETVRLDEEEDLEGELSFEEMLSVANPALNAAYRAGANIVDACRRAYDRKTADTAVEKAQPAYQQ